MVKPNSHARLSSAGEREEEAVELWNGSWGCAKCYGVVMWNGSRGCAKCHGL